MSRQLDAECGPLRAGFASTRVGMFVPPLVQCSSRDTDTQVGAATLELNTAEVLPDCEGMGAYSGGEGAAEAVAAVAAAHHLMGEEPPLTRKC